MIDKAVHLRRHLRFFPVLAAISLLVTGCAHTQTIRFRVVDAQTGVPLRDVRTVWREDHYDLILGDFHFGPTNLPPSQADGIIIVNGVYPKKASQFIFSREGYAPVYSSFSRGELLRADHAEVVSSRGEFIFDQGLRVVHPTNGFLIIEMRQE